MFNRVKFGFGRVLLLCMLFALAGCDLFSDGRVQIPTSIISMVPPPNYTISQRFPGLENTNVDGSFTINVFPQQSSEALGELFGSRERAEPTLNNRGIHVEGVETIPFEDSKILLFRGWQASEDDVEYEKWIGVFIKERPVMVAFQEPRPGILTKAQVMEAFASVRFDVQVHDQTTRPQ